MPESMYYFAFWLLTWFALTHNHLKPALYGSGLGVMLAILSLIKMYAIFLIPALILFLIFLAFTHEKKSRNKRILVSVFCMLSVLMILRLLTGYLIAGKTGLSLTGAKYEAYIPHALNLTHLKDILQIIHLPLLNHTSALILMFGIPIFILLARVCKRNQTTPADQDFTLFCFYTFSCLIFLVMGTIFLTAQMQGWNPYEFPDRIHMRFYNYIFPLFYMIAAHETYSKNTGHSSLYSWMMILVLVFPVFAFIFQLSPQLISFIDCPELFGFIYQHDIFILLSMLSIICLLAGLIRKKWGASLYFFIFLPFAILISTLFVNAELFYERFYSRDAYDRAGQFAHDFLSKDAS